MARVQVQTEAASRLQEQVRHVWLDFMQMKEFARNPFVVSGGEGIRIQTVDGKDYIDGLSGIFVVNVGYGNKAVISALAEQLHKLHFAPPLHGTNPAALDLAEAILAIAPEGFDVVKFASGGSEANEAAMKMARQYHLQSGHPRKYKVISRYRSYHGATSGALSATGVAERKSIFEPLVPGHIHTFQPYCYRCPFGLSYPSCGIACANIVRTTIEMEDPETVSAFIASRLPWGRTSSCHRPSTTPSFARSATT